MVRVNIINPKALADQHLIAEYNEILMLLGYVRRHPRTEGKNIPAEYRLGAGHILFFKDKLRYLKRRHESLKDEMRRRGFSPRKTILLTGLPNRLLQDWRPKQKDKTIIRARLIQKINAKKGFYRYCGRKESARILTNRIMNSD